MAAADVEGPPGDWTYTEEEPQAAVMPTSLLTLRS